MIFFLIWIVFAVATALIADAKNRNVIGWFVLSIVIGAFATIIVACLPRLDKTERQAASDASGYKVCPQCAETIKSAALVCRFCQHRFAPSVGGASPTHPWRLEEAYENGYGIYSYKGHRLTYTARGVKWQTSNFDSPAQAIAAIDAYR